MRRAGTIAGIVMMLIGVVWIFQGANVLPGSFMTGVTFWLYAGIALAIAGAGVLGFAMTRR